VTPEQIAQKEKEMREKHPKMFAHLGCKPGEVWYGDQLVDVVGMNISIYRQHGVPSAPARDAVNRRDFLCKTNRVDNSCLPSGRRANCPLGITEL